MAHQEKVWTWTRGQELEIPVSLIRWTHDTITDHFGDRFPLERTTMQLWRSKDDKDRANIIGHIAPLDVVIDIEGRFWSINNRRLAAYRMFQALSSTMVA